MPIEITEGPLIVGGECRVRIKNTDSGTGVRGYTVTFYGGLGPTADHDLGQDTGSLPAGNERSLGRTSGSFTVGDAEAR
jgi:hypothetical protein